jgi:hypothetical protein
MTFDELVELHSTTLSRLKSLYMVKGSYTTAVPGFQWEKYLADGWRFVGDVDAADVMRMYNTLGPSTDTSPVLIWLRAYDAWGKQNPTAHQQKIVDDIKAQSRYVLSPDLLGRVIPPSVSS